MSIQPGDTYLPRASISVFPWPSTLPMRTNRPPLIATSARTHGLPEPSRTRPFLMTKSYSDRARSEVLGRRSEVSARLGVGLGARGVTVAGAQPASVARMNHPRTQDPGPRTSFID